MPNPTSLSDPNQDPTAIPDLVNLSRISIKREKDNINTLPAVELLYEPGSSDAIVVVDDMKDKISAMGVIASKQEPSKRKIMNGSEHNNKQDKSPRDTMVGPRDGPVIEVCAKSQLEVSPKQFLRINKLKAWIEKKPTTVDETSPGVLKYKTPHFR